jgi:hypothetical protein
MGISMQELGSCSGETCEYVTGRREIVASEYEDRW